MYLSKITLDISSPSVRQSLRNCQDLHRSLMKAFNSTREEAGLLYRIFRTDHSIYIYAQSMLCPQWDRIDKAGYHCDRMQDISALITAFRTDTVLQFSLLAYPAKKVKGTGKNSKRILLHSEEERLNWLNAQGEKYGFIVISVRETAEERLLSGNKSSGSFSLNGIVFDGVLKIRDAAKFTDAFQRGIGAEKAYGFGMLMVGPVNT